ncbi:uncharacterized protein LOC122639217 [Telopea speciosissima]|uniref:uncharacterized protein LOC122639217 n=1 Tax=Telopea speciosissima TaxID=54955 RepID=UPI001CC3D499|nr:uncharacterized protein LOC122639217 [Telopea speciosissima]
MADPKPPSDNVQVQITTIKLSGVSNYLLWAQAVQAYIHAKGKLKYITDDPPNRDPKDPTTFTAHEEWMRENSIIKIWLWNSVELAIASNVMFHTLAKDVWNDLCESFSQERNISLEFHVAKFLAGLHPDYQSVKSQLLTGEKVEVFSRLNLLANSSKLGKIPKDNSAFVANRGRGHGRGQFRGRGRGSGSSGGGTGPQYMDKSARQCTHCGKPNHTVDTCWAKHGKPEWANELANVATTDTANEKTTSDMNQSPTTSSVSRDDYN